MEEQNGDGDGGVEGWRGGSGEEEQDAGSVFYIQW